MCAAVWLLRTKLGEPGIARRHSSLRLQLSRRWQRGRCVCWRRRCGVLALNRRRVSVWQVATVRCRVLMTVRRSRCRAGRDCRVGWCSISRVCGHTMRSGSCTWGISSTHIGCERCIVIGSMHCNHGAGAVRVMQKRCHAERRQLPGWCWRGAGAAWRRRLARLWLVGSVAVLQHSLRWRWRSRGTRIRCWASSSLAWFVMRTSGTRAARQALCAAARRHLGAADRSVWCFSVAVGTLALPRLLATLCCTYIGL